MIRWLNFINYSEDYSLEEAERWYLGYHTQEAKHQVGLMRYVTYKPIALPEEVLPVVPRWKQPNWVTELWYHDLDAWYRAAVEEVPKYTPAPGKDTLNNSRMLFTDENPDPDKEWIKKRLNREPDLDPERKLVRALWLLDLNIGQNVSLEEAERWYLETHTREVAEWQYEYGLRRYITYTALEYPEKFEKRLTPGHWMTKKYRWLTELWYPDIESFTKAKVELAGKYTPPPGGRDTTTNWQMTLVTQTPKYDFLKEIPKLP